jgi:hypothetical protein
MHDLMLSQDCLYTPAKRSLEGGQARRARSVCHPLPAIDSVAEFDAQLSIGQEVYPGVIAVQKSAFSRVPDRSSRLISGSTISPRSSFLQIHCGL